MPRPPQPHHCAIVVKLGDTHTWNLAQFCENMVTLHSPKNVIIFGDSAIARTWLGIN